MLRLCDREVGKRFAGDGGRGGPRDRALIMWYSETERKKSGPQGARDPTSTGHAEHHSARAAPTYEGVCPAALLLGGPGGCGVAALPCSPTRGTTREPLGLSSNRRE